MKTGFKLSAVVAGLTVLVGSVATQPVSAADRISMRYGGELPASIQQMQLPERLTAQADRASVDLALQSAQGQQQVLVRLRSPSVAKYRGKSPAAQVSHKERLKNEQSAFFKRAQKIAPGAKMFGSSQMVLNAVFLDVDAGMIQELAKDSDVMRISRVKNYEMDLSETVPYIGASAVQADGFDGTGVRVAVLDSGIDYNHLALGGSGNPADYAANNPDIIEPGTFPTAKVVGGFDFVGSAWPGGPLAPDPDPLDDGSQAGHGSHVGHIIGGTGSVAPGVDLYAVKVCSSVATSCSGVALINGMNFAVDPDGDGDPSDAVDVINMSLGSLYGQAFDDDLAFAVDNATALGVLSVVSAGNSSDKPYANGTPSSAATALSVAQTNVPSAVLPLMEVTAPGSIVGLYQAVFQPWSVPLASVIEEPVVYGNGSGGNLDGCAAFPPATFVGEIVLVDRGACNFTLKIKNIGDAGGSIGIIGLVAPGDPFSGGDGGEAPITVPGFMISQADSNALKSGLPATVARFDPAVGIPLIMAMVGSSSRGPQHESTTLIKPEIGAPGASVSATAGTGTGEGPFGGTSGAAPMVSGSAALLMQAYPDLTPLEVKARLMNNGETDILNDAVTGELAPITRIGGGEVRVDRAVGAPAAAWDDTGFSGSLSFGFVDASKDVQILQKKVRVRNYSDHAIQYDIEPTFRFADDAASGAVSVDVSPNPLNVPAGQDRTVNVKMTINGASLPGNFMNSGSQGANGSALTANEFDGYLNFDDGHHPIHMAWHVLPRRSADVNGARPVLTFNGGVDNINLTNVGVGTAQNDAYSLLAVSPNQPEGAPGQQSPMPDIRAVGINTIPVGAGFCSGQDSFLWLFAINTWERQEHVVPVIHNVILDTNQDDTDDFIVFNLDLNLGAISDGRQVTWVQNLATNELSAFFFAEHSTNTGNTVLLICGEQIGLTGTDMLSTNVDMDVFTQDFYYGGPGDFVGGLTVTPLGEQYFGIPSDIPGKGNGTMTVIDFGLFPGNSAELGVMLFTNGDRGTGARGGATKQTEALLFEAK